MPRPKRTKVAPSAPLRAKPTPARLRKEPSDPIEDSVSDQEEQPTSAKRVKRSALELVASSQSASRGRRSLNPAKVERERALQGQKADRDAALDRLDAEDADTNDPTIPSIEGLEGAASSSPPVEVGRRARGRVGVENSVLAISNFRRTRQPSILGRGRKGRSSSVESELAESAGMVNRPKRDNSVVPLAGVRRRQRQPSILGRRGARARSSSVGLEMATPLRNTGSVLGGRRRERQRSILGTARKARAVEAEYEDDDLELELENFTPDDESTPLNVSKARNAANINSDPQPLSSGSRKRKLSPLEPPRTSSPAKNDLDDVSDIYSASDAPLPQALSPPEADDSTIEPIPVEVPQQESINIPDDESSELESLASDLPALQDVHNEETDGEDVSSTMAPPHSSSSMGEDMLSPPRGRTNVQSSYRHQDVRKRTPVPQASDDDLPSSPPSLTHSPNHRMPAKHTTMKRNARKTKPVQDPAVLSTAELQALLPRRRPRIRDAFADSDDESTIDVTGLESDEDEISHLNVRASRRAAAPNKRTTKLKAKKPKGKNTRTYGTRKDNVAAAVAAASASDDEAEGGDDSLAPANEMTSPENSQELEERLGKELTRAKRKFENVDKWELDFEEITASSSSPRDAR